MAVFNGAESTSNYAGIYQYDPLGNVTDLGYSGLPPGGSPTSSPPRDSASLSAVGFYTATPEREL